VPSEERYSTEDSLDILQKYPINSIRIRIELNLIELNNYTIAILISEKENNDDE